jgi:hypothetical protein
MSNNWEDYEKEGKEIFQYMIHQYNNMFDMGRIKHFNIWYANWWMKTYYEEIKEKYYDEIHPDLIPWIQMEFESKRLFDSTNWKPFYYDGSTDCIYLGYKKLFTYQNYYFQLIVEPTCNDCIYCDRGENPIHFELALYGWKTSGLDNLQPYNDILVLSDNMMPEKDWKRKECY